MESKKYSDSKNSINEDMKVKEKIIHIDLQESQEIEKDSYARTIS